MYQKRSEHIKKLSETRLIHSTQEIKLFKVLSSFLEKFKMIKDRFGNDSYLQKEFESIGINSFNILRFIESRLHQEWAKTFTFFCQNANIDQSKIDQYQKEFMLNALKFYQEDK